MSYPHQFIACDFLSHPPIYVSLKSLVKSTLEKMDKNKVSTLTVTDETFSIVGTISKSQIERFMLRNRIRKTGRSKELYEKLQVSDILEENDSFVAAYPETDLKEIRRIMLATRSEYLPIAKNPWSKKLLGFIFLESIMHIF